MKILFDDDGVHIESPLGKIEGDSLLHFRVAVLLDESGKRISEKVTKSGRLIVVELEEEKDGVFS